ncbi:MAG: hypothetical protein RBR53_03300 [Desulforegulaceae bacterium]|nr:hypothetical protein [Desulforegulaceae bacterium]
MSGKKILKNGIWIKEQNGILTMGLVDDDEFEVEIGEKTSLQLFALELELQDALYGKNRIKFNPTNVNFEKLIQSLVKEPDFKDKEISAHFAGKVVIKADYDLLFEVFKSLLQKSFNGEGNGKVYINASVADDSLCVLYRDEVLSRKLESVDEIKKMVEKNLNGSIKVNDSVKIPYIDITIPEKK